MLAVPGEVFVMPRLVEGFSGLAVARCKWTDWGQSREAEGKVLFSEENCFDQPSLAEDHLSHPSQEEL